MTLPKRTLPPGVEDPDEDVVFGSMWITAGTLKLIRTTSANYSVHCQFWGQPTPAILETRTDLAYNDSARTQRYDVKCPAPFFAEYLTEMNNKLKIEVEGVGKVMFDLTKFLKHNVSIDSKEVFDHCKGSFEVIGKGNRKAGLLELQVGCSFDPNIALQVLGEESVENMRQSEIQKCPCTHGPPMCCGGVCICHRQSKVLGKPKINQKAAEKDTDSRIPHSLDVQERRKEEFAADKYEMKPEDYQAERKREQKQKQKDRLRQRDRERAVEEDMRKEQQNKDFPEVPKILTYSNLRLDYNDEEEERSPPPQRYMEASERDSLKERDGINEVAKTTTRRQDKIASSVEESNFQIKKQPQISKDDLFKEFYGAANSPEKFFEQIIPKRVPQAPLPEFNTEQRPVQQVEALSRVVDLDQQLHRVPLEPPPRLSYQQTGSQFRATEKRRKTHSHLVMSLVVELQASSIQAGTKNLFTIAHRPYGKKERVVLGPQFGEVITVICPVGEHEIKKMDKLPFILQFWDSVTNKFLGLIKLNLGKIKKGFILNGRLNQIAVKTNLVPTTIHRGRIDLVSITDQLVGSAQIYAAIGTATQLNNHLNETAARFNETRMQNPQRQQSPVRISPRNSPQKGLSARDPIKDNAQQTEGLMRSFDRLMMALDEHSQQIIEQLILLVKQKYVTLETFDSLCKSMGINSSANIFNVLSRVSDKNGLADFTLLSSCFDDYKEVSQRLTADLKKDELSLRKSVRDIPAFLKQARQIATFRVIPRDKFQQLLCSFASKDVATSYCSKLSDHINLDQIENSFLQNKKDQPTLLHFNDPHVSAVAAEFVLSKLHPQTPDQMLTALNEKAETTVEAFGGWSASCGKACSVWLILHLFQHIRRQFQLDEALPPTSTALACLYNWWAKQGKNESSKERAQVNKQDSQIQHDQPSLEERKQNINDSNISQEANPLPNDSIKQPESVPNPQPKPPQNEGSPAKQNESAVEQKEQKEEKPSIYRHLFSLEPTELTLDAPLKGNCVVSYSFPFEEENIKSKAFAAFIDKHKYPLKMYGTHGFSIQEPVQNYLGDNVVQFYVRIDERIEYEGALHVDELLIPANSTEQKVIPLFSDRVEGMAGKLKIGVQYEMGLNSEHTLGKETTYQLFLPKTGFLNYDFGCQVDIAKVRSQLNIREQFYIALVLDVFHAAPNLKSIFPSISSTLYADFSAPLQLFGSIKMTLSSVVLQYFKARTAKLSMNIVYYSKERGNFQRKEVSYANIQFPLINIIKSDGLRGDYAFKNKLGMFVTVARANLKYEKNAAVKAVDARADLEKGKQFFWVVLHFLQFLNFESELLNWIRFQFVLKGKKYQTDKIHLQSQTINPLRGEPNIVLKLSEVDFADTKVLPITIYSNASEKLAIDLNLKSFGKGLLHQKSAVNNHYYTVVNQSSRPLKMRVGLKTYGFRGGPTLSAFIEPLVKSLDFQIFDEMDLPNQVSDYDRMLSMLRNKLKLSPSKMEEMMGELLVNKRRDKLPFDFFTNRTHFKLDFTPIISQNESEIDYICEDLPSEVAPHQLSEYLRNNGIRLINFRQQFLQRYTFKELNKMKMDKNVQFLGIEDQVDLICFLRKLKVAEGEQANNTVLGVGQLELTILEGVDFHLLYNGIKPNAIVRLPELGIQTQVSHRTSNPYFNECFQEQLDSLRLQQLKRLVVQVYHCSIDDDDAENILIGSGTLVVPVAEVRHAPKVMKCLVTSAMSSKKKASINIKIGVSEQAHRGGEASMMESKREWESGEASRIGGLLHDIKNEMAQKNDLFESSSDDDF